MTLALFSTSLSWFLRRSVSASSAAYAAASAFASWRPRSKSCNGIRSISRLMSVGMESPKGAKGRMCGGGAARVDDAGELGRWSLERSSPGLAAVRRESGAEGETFAESVPAVAESDAGSAAGAAKAEFLFENDFGFMVFLLGARGGEGNAGNSRGVCGFGMGLGEQWLGLYSLSR